MTVPLPPLDVPCEFCGAVAGQPCAGKQLYNARDRKWFTLPPPARMGHLSRIRDSNWKFNQDKAAIGPSVIATKEE